MQTSSLLEQLQIAADYMAVTRALRRSALRAIPIGVAAVFLGGWSMSQSPVNGLLALIGLIMVASGVLNLLTWSLAGMAADGFSMVALATWLIGATLHNALDDGGQILFAVIGFVVLLFGLHSLSRFGRFSRAACNRPPQSLSKLVDQAVAQVEEDFATGAPGTFEIAANQVGRSISWHAWLGRDFAILVAEGAGDVLFADRDSLQITPSAQRSDRKQMPVEVRTDYLRQQAPESGLVGSMQAEDYETYLRWHGGADVTKSARGLRVA